MKLGLAGYPPARSIHSTLARLLFGIYRCGRASSLGPSSSGASVARPSDVVTQTNSALNCTPTKLMATFNNPGANAQLRVGEAQTSRVQVADDCNNPLVPSSSSAALFDSSIGGALLANLTSANLSGLWTAPGLRSLPERCRCAFTPRKGRHSGESQLRPPAVRGGRDRAAREYQHSPSAHGGNQWSQLRH